MHLIIAYDISDNKRRERLRKTLLRFGNPVQYSVFELDLTARQIEQLRRAVGKVIVPAIDNVRFYMLCQKCSRGVETFGGKPLFNSERVIIV